ncbi:MAG: TetR/AcrR family transcriptional regulator, partial [Planctomycetota bacterium]
MRSSRRDARETQERLLAAAGAVFAEKGYEKTTVAEICQKAGANIASVNYHFGSKKKLYAEAWRNEFRKSIEAHPPAGGVPKCAPAEERLRGRILSLLRRVLDKDCLEFDIIHKEMASPTGLLHEVARESIGPIRRELAGIVRELLGKGSTDKEVRLCKRSIMSQCIGPL